MATSFHINIHDLEFMLKQIKIAEDHAGGKTLLQSIMDAYGATAANAAQLPAGLRTVDGSQNSLLPGQEGFGAADELFPRLLAPVFINEGDEAAFFGVTNTDYAAGGNLVDSDPRTISNLINNQTAANPAAVMAALQYSVFTGVLAPADVAAAANAIAVAYGATINQPDAGLRAAAEAALTAALTSYGIEQGPEGGLVIPNLSPDIGLSPGFNSWMTYFGQFFDHGLDLVSKGGNGTIFIPLQADDPLIAGADKVFGTADDLAPNLRFMAVTRLTTSIDLNGDGVIGAGETGLTQGQNGTTSFVDQNQTYTSHASHQVFLREYATVGGVTRSTGNLLDGMDANGVSTGAIANWAEVKANALQYLGIELTDYDVGNVPWLRTDAYGRFIPDANGYAQVIVGVGADGKVNTADDIVVSGTPAAPVSLANALGTGHAFLNDIAHHAGPGFVDNNRNGVFDGGDVLQVADADPGVGDDHLSSTYDDEMLNAHFVTGDGRGNENIALTAVHSIFHSEHNRTVEANKHTLLENATTPEGLAFLNEWLLVDVAVVPADLTTLVWDGERLFQAARFSTEMQYQHLVFEEFARRVQPAVDPFVFNPTIEIDASIVAEFAHTVYRFGHSMLTDTVDRLENDLTTVGGAASQETLIAAFLNPQMYLASGQTIAEANANIVRGLSRDLGAEIDEFVVPALQTNLLGLPLDLPAINMARGRDAGIPSLNETRAQLYNDFGLADLKPYTSWADFALNIKNPLSVINFIAAYGTHATITAATTLEGKRLAAYELVTGVDVNGDLSTPADRVAFLNATGAYAGGELGGLNNVDLWVGGLAEAKMEFGGMLGSTFNFIFEYQMERLQNGDRFYYLSRTQGLNMLFQLEPNTFADIVMRNTDLGADYATHLSGSLFITPDHILELDQAIAQEDYNGAAAGLDPEWEGLDPVTGAIKGPQVVRDYTNATVGLDGHTVGGSIKVYGGAHYVLGGTEGNDTLMSDKGIDTIWGDGGNDYINAGTESDNVFGGAGDDIIEDPFGDDFLRGEDGNDVIAAARGLDIIDGGAGSDAVILGQDASEVFGGEGDDFILGGNGSDALLGNEGNDWIEGAGGFDGIAGDNSELFFNSTVIGHDVMFAQGDESDYDAESGDDIMGSGASVFRYEGMLGFDWAIGKGDFSVGGVDFDFDIPIFTAEANEILRDRFDQVEAASGWAYDDVISGDDRGSVAVEGGVPGQLLETTFAGNEMNQESVNRITGMNEWFGSSTVGAMDADGTDGRYTLFGPGGVAAGPDLPSTFRNGNILMGGDGNDVLQGRGGFDMLDGDAYLNVRIKIVVGGVTYSAESMNTDTVAMGQYAGKVYFTNTDGTPDFTSPAFGGRSLNSLLLDRTINPGQMSIVRELLVDTTAGNIDTAVYRGNAADYVLEGAVDLNNDGDFIDAGELDTVADLNGDSFITITDRRAGNVIDDTDLLKNIELLQFADQTINLANLVVPVLDLEGATPVSTGFATTFTETAGAETGAAVGISLASRIIDSAPAIITSAVVTLTNAKAADALSLSGSLFAGLTAVTDTSVAGVITMTITGAGSLAAYEAAIDLIRFVNTSQNPDTTARIITATVSDGTHTSAVATATVNVVATNDAPEVGADLIITNAVAFDVPEWALLANDSDRDGQALNVTGTSAAAGVTATLNGAGDTIAIAGGPGSFTASVSDGVATVNGTVTVAADVFNEVDGTAGNDILIGNDAGSTFLGNGGNDIVIGGVGDDTVDGGAGNDHIVWSVGAGRDLINGGADIDTFTINGNGTDETFFVYTAAAAAGLGITGLNAATEIVVTRAAAFGVPTNADIVAELDNIEEIVVNTGAGNDFVVVGGDFAGTSLAINTIHVNSGSGNTVVDINDLHSEHRIVLTGNGGEDSIVGGDRPQDEFHVGTVPTEAPVDLPTRDVWANKRANVLTGSDDHNDVFHFPTYKSARGDTINNFEPGDKIDLSGIDANMKMGGNQTFTLVTDGLDELGDLMVTHEMRGGDAYTVVAGNIKGSDKAEFAIKIKGFHELTENDFLL